MRTTKPNEIIEKITGLWVEDGPAPVGLLGWMQDQCRNGSLHKVVERFCASQPEPLDPSRLRVTSTTAALIEAVIPVKVVDHESPTPLMIEVRLHLDPLKGTATRL